MSEPLDAGEAPVPDAAPAPVPADPIPPPAQEEPVTSQASPDPSERAAQLIAELAEIRTAAVSGGTTLLRVAPPHDSFSFGAVTVSSAPTPVPVSAAAALLTAAAEAGVTLEEA